MSYENPTRLRIGMQGNLGGKVFQVAGRVVLGVMDGGEPYYWNEFHLQAQTGDEATLVYEETERGGEWRLFTMFEPEFPMTAADAATKREGDQLNLNGRDVRVTLVDSSRVYSIEGRAPEGVEVGDVANYFNAEAGAAMQVVSWTGEEVEYYNGLNLTRGMVDAAFNLPRQTMTSKLSSAAWGGSASEDQGINWSFAVKAFVVIGFLFFFLFGYKLSCSASHESRPVTRQYAVPPPLMIGATGRWTEKNFRITAHAAIEIGEVGAVYERNEYELTGDDGKVTLLVCGEKPGAKDWVLFTPLDPLVPPTAQESAAQKVGDRVNIDGVTATVRELFQSTVSRTENVAPGDWHVGDVSFGYIGQAEYGLLLVRWDNSRINFYRGKDISAKEFIAAFSGSNGK
jgi:hypothetical protein